ncbi:phage late control D family protein [Haliangium sp.]|uniref:phage late control D family protein n=1 Tax=Haliangium sp. TaxID=2663208 RepID=UPI003D09D4D5
MAEQNIASAVGFKVTCGQEVEGTHLVSFVIDQDLGQPDMCAVTIRNEDNRYSGQIKLGDDVKISVGDGGGTPVFTGEVVGLEPVYKANGENTVTVRAFNRMHRLLRGRKSKTFLDRTDQDIASAVAGEHSLSPQVGNDPKITHKHVYQHNQTDLEFLRVRAARLGFDVWVEDKKLFFDQPKSDRDSGIKLRYGDAESAQSGGAVFLKYFAPRMSSAGVVGKVTVRGWNPEKKEEIVGEAEAQSSKLGKKDANAASSVFGKTATFEVDHPIFSVQEAQAIAKAKLREAMMGYITGEGECRGMPDIKPGIVISVTVNPDDANDRFNGKYLVVGSSHRYTNPTRGDAGGYVTGLRLSRDAEGPA